MPDHDGYPTKEELQSILDFEGTPHEFVNELIENMWWNGGFTVTQEYDDILDERTIKLSISTWGWSGNEDIVGVMKQTWFWFQWWELSRRGGHYTFEIPVDKYRVPLTIGKYGLPHSSIDK